VLAQTRALFRLGATPSFERSYTAEYVRLMPMLTERTHGGQVMMLTMMMMMLVLLVLTHSLPQGHRHFPGADAPDDVWSVSQLAAARLNRSDVFFSPMEATWVEQRKGLEAAIAAEFALIEAPAPSAKSLLAAGYTELPRAEWAKVCSCSSCSLVSLSKSLLLILQ